MTNARCPYKESHSHSRTDNAVLIWTLYKFIFLCVCVCVHVTDEKTGTLKLSNLSSSMSGKYVCTASNTAGNDSCYINLEVITCTY